MKLAMLWVGHIRTFHRIWPTSVNDNIFVPLGVKQTTHYFFTYPDTQCKRNRANDPPSDYSHENALNYVQNILQPRFLEVREASVQARETVAEIRQARTEQGADWNNLEALTLQYVRRTEAWKSFVKLEPSWQKFDLIVFNRPDVFLYGCMVKPKSFEPDDIHVFTSLGPQKDITGLDDRWAMGHPSAIERYMSVGDSITRQYAIERRSWCPEEVNRRHAELTGLRIVKCSYQNWSTDLPQWEKDHVGIARFQNDDGQTLEAALQRYRDNNDKSSET